MEIIKAMYGHEGNWIDVTKEIKAMDNEGEISFTVSPQNIGVLDPAPGVTKSLQAQVVINKGSPTTIIAEDFNTFKISAPADKTKRSALKDQAYVGFSVFKYIATAIYMAVVGYGAGSGYMMFGNVFMTDSWLTKGIGAMLGSAGEYSYFPIVVFFMRLFRETDVVTII
jgi:hypothetical protein